MRQKSIGEVLRLARENAGWNFVELQKMTKIQARYLQALEHNDFDAIPDATYTRAFLQRYAEVVGLDADVLIEAYNKNTLVAVYTSGDEEEVLSELKRGYKVKRPNASYKPLIYLLLLAVLIVAFLVYIVQSRMQNQPTDTTPSSTSYAVHSQTVEETSTAVTSTSSSSSTPASSSASQTEGVQVVATGSGEHIHVTVTGAKYPIAIELSAMDTTSWVNLNNTSLAGGVTLSTETPSAQTTLEEGVTSSYVTMGVVKGVSIKIAGQTVDLSGLTTPSGYITISVQ